MIVEVSVLGKVNVTAEEFVSHIVSHTEKQQREIEAVFIWIS